MSLSVVEQLENLSATLGWQDELVNAYLLREVAFYSELQSAAQQSKRNPYLQIASNWINQSNWEGDDLSQFWTALANTMVRVFNHIKPNQAVIEGFESWDIQDEDKSRLLFQTQIFTSYSLLTAFVVVLQDSILKGYESPEIEVLKAQGLIVRGGFRVTNEEDLLVMLRAVRACAKEISRDDEHSRILIHAAGFLLSEGDDSPGFKSLIKESVRRVTLIAINMNSSLKPCY